MNFSSFLLCGLISSCFSFRVTGSSEDVSVSQSPLSITVDEGESAHINCCWNTTTKVKVFWLKNGTKLSAGNQQYQISSVENCSTLHITNITPNDTGDYVCKVTIDIPFLIESEGQKTVLTVNNNQGTETPTTEEKPVIVENPKTHLEEKISVDGHSLDSPNESRELRDVVLIYMLRCLPFCCLLVAFFYLNRDIKRTITSKADEHAVTSGGQSEEDLESGNEQRNETEGVKQAEEASVEQEGCDITEKPKTGEKTEEEKDKQEKDKEPVVDLNAEDVMVGTSTLKKLHLL